MPFMTCVYMLPEFWGCYFPISTFCSEWWMMRTHVHSLQRPDLKRRSHTRINTHLQKCSEQGTPKRPACSRLVTWWRSKTKEIFNKVCCWLFTSSTSFRAALSLWQSEKVSNYLKIYFQGYLSQKNKLIKQFRKTPLIKFKAVGKGNPDFEFPPFMTWLISSQIS
jgi:hypothetical protein